LNVNAEKYKGEAASPYFKQTLHFQRN